MHHRCDELGEPAQLHPLLQADPAPRRGNHHQVAQRQPVRGQRQPQADLPRVELERPDRLVDGTVQATGVVEQPRRQPGGVGGIDPRVNAVHQLLCAPADRFRHRSRRRRRQHLLQDHWQETQKLDLRLVVPGVVDS